MSLGRARLTRPLRGVEVAGAAALIAAAVWPASAQAADLFPLDDWLGAGIKGAGEVVLGPLKIGAQEIAGLLVTIVGTLADLLVPKSVVRAGLDGVRWLVALPPVGAPVAQDGSGLGVRMPHLVELRGVLTWIGVSLLPLGVIVSAGRAVLTPGLEGESLSELLARVLAAAVGLVLYDWAWGVLTRLVGLITDALLGLPWVADGVERMLETLLIGGTTGTVAAAEFVIPLLILGAGATLLGLMLVHVGLMVATALVYVLGGLVLGLSVTSFGRRLLAAWMIAATAVVVVPVLWSVVFVTGAALMLDAQPAAGHGFAGFVAQLFNVAAAGATFFVAIKLSLAVFRNATGAITGIASSAAPAGASAAGPGRRLAANATPAGLARFSQQLRGRAAGLAGVGARAAAGPLGRSARALGTAARTGAHPVQATQRAAGALRAALSPMGTSGAGAPPAAVRANPARAAAGSAGHGPAGPGGSAPGSVSSASRAARPAGRRVLLGGRSPAATPAAGTPAASSSTPRPSRRRAVFSRLARSAGVPAASGAARRGAQPLPWWAVRRRWQGRLNRKRGGGTP